MIRSACAVAHSNIALVKYWGKRSGGHPDLNLPAVGSLSMTLDELRTETRVAPSPLDRFELDGEQIAGEPAQKVFRHLDRVWTAVGERGARAPCTVVSANHLPTAAGLASSASGFAALTVAAAAAFGAQLDASTLSALARRGSGSAARSLWGGFVRLDAGEAQDGSDCVARPLLGPHHWDLRLVVVETARGPKSLGSTGGMERCRATSPYYAPWVDTSRADLDAAEAALRARDLPALGAIVEHSCFKMHACMFASRPPLLYWNGRTIDVIDEVWRARAQGWVGFVTSDAGPHVKVLCEASHAAQLVERLSRVPGVSGVRSLAAGPAARVEIVEVPQ